MHSDYYETLIHKHLSNELSSSEREAFDLWLASSGENRQRLEEAERIWTLSADAAPSFDIDLNKEMDRFKARIAEKPAETRVTPIYSYRLVQFAAAAAVLLGGIILLLRLGGASEPSPTIIETMAGEVRAVTLPDQSSILLNESSSLQFTASFDKRTVKLEGEAFFDVMHDPDSPFEIESGVGRVRVLGTSFSVRNRDDDDAIRVVVSTGTVALIHAEAQQRLEAGYQGVLEKQTGMLTSFPNNDPAFFNWKIQPLLFDNSSVQDVIANLRARFGIVITEPTPALASCTFTGSFDAPDLTQIIDALAFSLNVDVAVEEGVYTFTGTGCNS